MGKEWARKLFDLNSNLKYLSCKHISERMINVKDFINYAVNIYKKKQS